MNKNLQPWGDRKWTLIEFEHKTVVVCGKCLSPWNVMPCEDGVLQCQNCFTADPVPFELR